MNGIPETLEDMGSADVYAWDTRDMKPVEARNKDVGNEFKNKKKASSGTKKTETAKKKTEADPSSSKSG